MLGYLVHRVLMMIPTVLVISALVFVIIQLPEGDYLTTHITELESQGEKVSKEKIAFLREQYGLDKPMWEQYFVWLFGMLRGDFGYSFEYSLPVSEVVGDRLFLSFLLSFSTIVFTWAVAFPIGVYSATHQYSWADHSRTFIGFLGLATPNFLLALVLLYFANVVFGTSVGGLMDPQYIDQPMSWGKLLSVLEHLWIPVLVAAVSVLGFFYIARLRVVMVPSLAIFAGAAAARIAELSRDRARQAVVIAGVLALMGFAAAKIPLLDSDTSNDWNKAGGVLRVMGRYAEAETALERARTANLPLPATAPRPSSRPTPRPSSPSSSRAACACTCSRPSWTRA